VVHHIKRHMISICPIRVMLTLITLSRFCLPGRCLLVKIIILYLFWCSIVHMWTEKAFSSWPLYLFDMTPILFEYNPYFWHKKSFRLIFFFFFYFPQLALESVIFPKCLEFFLSFKISFWKKRYLEIKILGPVLLLVATGCDCF